MAYSSVEAGRSEVYVRPFPAREGGGQWVVSDVPSRFPVWSHATNEIFFQTTGGKIEVADYRTDGEAFVPGTPRVWCDTEVPSLGISFNYDVAPDGKRAIVPTRSDSASNGRSVHAVFLLNFFEELKRRVP